MKANSLKLAKPENTNNHLYFIIFLFEVYVVEITHKRTKGKIYFVSHFRCSRGFNLQDSLKGKI